MKRASIFLAVLSLCSACHAASPPVDRGFLPFWTRFRASVLSGDAAALRSLVKLPLQIGFDSDQDQSKMVTAGQFLAFFRTELRCPAAEGGTNLDMIRAKPRADGRFDFHDARRATVGPFSFASGPAGWRLTLVNYGTPQDLQMRLKGQC